MELKGQHILSTKQFDRETLLDLFEEAKNLGKEPVLNGKIMAALFFEPSTRTRFSFETAMLRLGGGVISNADMMHTSSVTKKETLKDMGKVVSKMVDVIVMRHPDVGSVEALAKVSDVPVINAGDGANEHPTQALLDLFTIWMEKGTLDGLKIGLVGDLKYGRVPHSDFDLLRHFDSEIILVSPESLRMPAEVLGGKECREVESLEDVIGELDVIGMSRVQKERFSDEAEYERVAGSYVLDAALMSKAKSDAIVMHPLPRVDEISAEVDGDSRAKYFDQVAYGVQVRKALLKQVLL